MTANAILPNLVGIMAKPRLLFILTVLATAALLLLFSPFAPTGSGARGRVFDRTVFPFCLPGILIGSLFAFWISRIRANSFGQHWRVPSSAYVVPAWIVWLMTASACGYVLASLVASVFVGTRILPLFGSSLVISTAFGLGAWHRLRSRQKEFEIPWFHAWRRLFR